MTQSSLIKIPGIGPKTIEKLFIRFRSVDGIRAASLEEITGEIGARRASLVDTYFRAIAN